MPEFYIYGKIKVQVSWCDKNFAAAASGEQINGVVLVTAKSWKALKKSFSEALQFHVEGSIMAGDELFEWFRNGQYDLEYSFNTTALLRFAKEYITLEALSRVTGINKSVLSRYADGKQEIRPKNQEKIVDGIHKIGKEFFCCCVGYCLTPLSSHNPAKKLVGFIFHYIMLL